MGEELERSTLWFSHASDDAFYNFRHIKNDGQTKILGLVILVVLQPKMLCGCLFKVCLCMIIVCAYHFAVMKHKLQ